MALLCLAYAAGVWMLDWQEHQSKPGLEYKAVTFTAFEQHFPGRLKIDELNTSGQQELSASDSRRYRQADVQFSINGQSFSASNNVWIDTEASNADIAQRYLSRFQLVLLSKDQAVVKGGVIETLQDQYTLASRPLFNLWLIDASGGVEHAQTIKHSDALSSSTWKALFISSHHARSWGIPPLVAIMVGISALLVGLNTYWSRGGWGVFSTTVLFVTPLLAAGPLLTTVGWHYFTPTIFLSYLITVTVAAFVSSKMRLRAPSIVKQRIRKAGVVPAVALLAAVLSVVSLSLLLSVPTDVLGAAGSGEAGSRRIVAPALQLLSAGTGVAVFLMLLGVAYGFLVNSRFYSRKALPTDPFA